MPDRALTLRIARSTGGFLLTVAHKTKEGEPEHSETTVEQEKDDLSGSILLASCETAIAELLSRCSDDDVKSVAETPIGRAAK